MFETTVVTQVSLNLLLVKPSSCSSHDQIKAHFSYLPLTFGTITRDS